MFLHFQNRQFTNIAKICKKTSSLRMNTSSVFTYRCLWDDVRVATHILLSVVILAAVLVTPLQRNSYKMNFSTNKDKKIRLRDIGELYHTPAYTQWLFGLLPHRTYLHLRLRAPSSSLCELFHARLLYHDFERFYTLKTLKVSTQLMSQSTTTRKTTTANQIPDFEDFEGHRFASPAASWVKYCASFQSWQGQVHIS